MCEDIKPLEGHSLARFSARMKLQDMAKCLKIMKGRIISDPDSMMYYYTEVEKLLMIVQESWKIKEINLTHNIILLMGTSVKSEVLRGVNSLQI